MAATDMAAATITATVTEGAIAVDTGADIGTATVVVTTEDTVDTRAGTEAVMAADTEVGMRGVTPVIAEDTAVAGTPVAMASMVAAGDTNQARFA